MKRIFLKWVVLGVLTGVGGHVNGQWLSLIHI